MPPGRKKRSKEGKKVKKKRRKEEALAWFGLAALAKTDAAMSHN